MPAAKSLPLPFAVPRQDTPEKSWPRQPAATPRPKQLWLALWLPQLALEVCEYHRDTPAIVSEERRGRFVVAAANTAADRFGISAGLEVSAAWALCPQLHVAVREPAAEKQRLQHLARRLYQYSGVVSVRLPDMLLVEIRASLRLFHGLKRLLQRIEHTMQTSGHSCHCGVAPAPAAARLLAFAQDDNPVFETGALASRLGRLPVSLIAGDLPAVYPRLQKLGLRCLTDLFRLPRAGLRRRFGSELVHWLEKLLAQRPDQPEKWTPPLHYRAQQNLDEPLSAIDELWPFIDRLLQDFCAWLRARSLHGNGFVLRFYHHGQAATRLKLGLLRPGNNADAMLSLLALRMQRERLNAPVIGLQLDGLRLGKALATNTAWWADAQDADNHWWHTIAGLQARLGTQAVRGLACDDDLRPELAWQTTRIQTAGPPPGNNPCPAWLLAEPRPLSVEQIKRLRLVRRPERIVNGWWSDASVRRDYFKARAGKQTWWVFRDARGWFLHGYYEPTQ